MSGSATNVPFKAPQLCHLRRNRRRIAAGKVRLRGWSGSAFVFWCVGELEGPHARLSQGPAGRECRAPNIRHFHNHDRQQHFSVIIIVTIIILREGTFIHRHTYIHIYTFIPTIYTDIYKYIQYVQYIQIYTNIYLPIYKYIQIYTNIYKFVLSFLFLACVTGKTLSFLWEDSIYVKDLERPPPSSFNDCWWGENLVKYLNWWCNETENIFAAYIDEYRYSNS